MKFCMTEQKVEINLLKIDKKTLTKTKLLILPIISHMDALDLLMKGQVKLIARFPYELYAESIKGRDKLLGTTSNHPPSELLKRYQNYELTGVLLYDSELKALSKTWFIANEFITKEMAMLNNAYDELIKTVKLLNALDKNKFSEHEIIHILKNYPALPEYIQDQNFIKYIQVCKVLDEYDKYHDFSNIDEPPTLPHGPKRQTRSTMTKQKTQKWFDNIELTENALSNWLDEPLDQEWGESFIMSPFDFRDWEETKKWLESSNKMQMNNVKNQIDVINNAYNSVMREYNKTPIILV